MGEVLDRNLDFEMFSRIRQGATTSVFFFVRHAAYKQLRERRD